MTNEEQIDWLCRLRADLNNGIIYTPWNKEFTEALTEVLEPQSSEDCEDAISREDTLNKINALIAEYIPIMPIGWTLPLNIAKTINELPSVQPQPKIDEIIKRIEETRDKDKIAEYPYNRCIKIIREVLGDD